MGAVAGVDWAKDEHAVAVGDAAGDALAEDVLCHHEDLVGTRVALASTPALGG